MASAPEATVCGPPPAARLSPCIRCRRWWRARWRGAIALCAYPAGTILRAQRTPAVVSKLFTPGPTLPEAALPHDEPRLILPTAVTVKFVDGAHHSQSLASVERRHGAKLPRHRAVPPSRGRSGSSAAARLATRSPGIQIHACNVSTMEAASDASPMRPAPLPSVPQRSIAIVSPEACQSCHWAGLYEPVVAASAATPEPPQTACRWR